MVHEAIALVLVIFLFQGCTQKRPHFFRENEVHKVIEELEFNNEKSFFFLIVRTNRCDLCTDVARDIFNSKRNNIFVLIDFDDRGFRQSESNSNNSIVIKPNQYFQSRGIDFSENYFFLIENGRIKNFSIVSRETKDKIIELTKEVLN